MKKIISVILCFAICFLCISGCGKKEPFSAIYMAEDADLSMAPDLILEPKEPPYNLGGWMMNNTVAYELELPQVDEYTFNIEYSRPGGTGEAEATVYMTTPDSDDFIEKELTFPSTSKEERDWRIYSSVEFTVALPAGNTLLFLEPDYLPEGCDHFINLRSITVTGTKPFDGQIEKPKKKTPTPDVTESDIACFDGWWTVSPNYYEGVIPIISTFLVDTETLTWTPYDKTGNPGDTMDCSFPDDHTIVLDMEQMGSQEMTIEDQILFYTDDGHEAYVKTEDPEFIQTGSYAGFWYFMDDPESGIYYELTDTHAVKVGGDSEIDTDYQVSIQNVFGETDSLDIPFLDLPYPGRPLYPSKDGKVMIESDLLRNNVYVRDNTPVQKAYSAIMDQLVNSTFISDDENEGESYHSLSFDANFTFNIYLMTLQEDGSYSQDTSAGQTLGMWSMDEDNHLLITYEGGAEENIDLNNWDGTLYLEQLDRQFVRDSYFPYW